MFSPDVYGLLTNLNFRSVTMRVARMAAVLALALPMAANAQVINQNAPTNNASMAGFEQGDLAQSFKQSVNNIVGAGIFLDAGFGGSASTLTIELWNALPNAGGAMMLATGSTAINGNNVWADVFWAQTNITAGQTYFLRFLEATTSYGISGDVNNGYANGQVYANAGYDGFSAFDYTFRTYASDGMAVVPEPATYALMVSGLAMIGGAGVIRRRRQA